MAEPETEASLTLGHAMIAPEPKPTKMNRKATVSFEVGYKKWKRARTTLTESKNESYD